MFLLSHTALFRQVEKYSSDEPCQISRLSLWLILFSGFGALVAVHGLDASGRLRGDGFTGDRENGAMDCLGQGATQIRV
jgi:hypothetical protein